MKEEMIELKTSDTSYSRSECFKYQGITILNETNSVLCEGEYDIEGTKSRFHKGLLHGGNSSDGFEQPAYEKLDGHTEYLTNGLLHKEGSPAVISNYGTWEEYWNNGQLILIRSFGSIEKYVEVV